MSDIPSLPGPRIAIATRDGGISQPWFQFLRDLASRQGVDASAEIAALARKLGSPDGSIDGIPEPAPAATVIGVGGVQSSGTLADGRVTLFLRQLEDTGVGTFKLITRDVFGRVEGTQDGTGADVPVDDAAWTWISGAEVQAALDSVDSEIGEARTVAEWGGITGDIADQTDLLPYLDGFYDSLGSAAAALAAAQGYTDDVAATLEPAIAPGTTGQFWRGDKTFSNLIDGRFFIGQQTAAVPGTQALIIDTDDAVAQGAMAMIRYSNSTTSPFFGAFKARGTKASPLGVNANDQLFELRGTGRTNAGTWAPAQAATLAFRAAEAFTATANGTSAIMRLTPIGSTTSVLLHEWRGDGSYVPLTNNAYSIGTSALNWNAVYSTAFYSGASQVVGARRTGWAAATGTATRTTFDTATVTTAQLAERMKALLDDLIAHGLIGA